MGTRQSGFSYEPGLLLFGGGVAALGGWYVVRPLPSPPRRVMAVCGVVALPVVVGISAVGISVLESPAALVASTAVAMGLVLALPLVGEAVATRLETPESTWWWSVICRQRLSQREWAALLDGSQQ